MGYAAMVSRGAQGGYLSWSLLGSAVFGLTVATFIRRARPIEAEWGLPTALALVPAFAVAIVASRQADLGFIAASLIGLPVSALVLLPFVGAATREKPAEGTVLPGIGAAGAFLLVLVVALGTAYAVGVGRLLFAVSATASVGAQAVQAGLAELGGFGRLYVWGLLAGALPLTTIILQLRRNGRIVQPALLAALPVLLVCWPMQMLVTSRSQTMLTRLAVGPSGGERSAPAARETDSTSGAGFRAADSQPAVPRAGVDTIRGVAGGVVGGIGTTPGPESPPELVTRVAPQYPATARQARVGGNVIVEVEIDSTGRVTHTSVLRSHPLFTEAAVEAIRQWRYRPALRDGRPVASKRVETVDFTLPP
jgi:TonB family protein